MRVREKHTGPTGQSAPLIRTFFAAFVFFADDFRQRARTFFIADSRRSFCSGSPTEIRRCVGMP